MSLSLAVVLTDIDAAGFRPKTMRPNRLFIVICTVQIGVQAQIGPRLASARSEPPKLAPLKSAQLKSALMRLTFCIFAWRSSAPLKIAFSQFAPLKLASGQSALSRLVAFSVAHCPPSLPRSQPNTSPLINLIHACRLVHRRSALRRSACAMLLLTKRARCSWLRACRHRKDRRQTCRFR